MNNVPQAADQMLPALGALVIVLALILALAWVAKRWMGTPGISRSSFKVLGAMSLGPREKLLLVDVGGKQVLLGVTPGSITSLQTLAEPVDLNNPVTSEREAPAPAPFAAVLAKVSGRTSSQASH